MSAEFNQHFTFQGKSDGPRLIILGAVHGNETCGTKAIQQVMARLESDELILQRGRVTFVPVANPLAYQNDRRFGDRNLNRMLQPYAEPKTYEDHIANWLCPLLAQHDVLLDLHSFQGDGQPFVMVGPENNAGPIEPFQFAAQELELTKILGVQRAVDGWLETYDHGIKRRQSAQGNLYELAEQNVQFGVGTTEYMRSQGGYAVTLECGNHVDPDAPDVALRAILNTLTHLALTNSPTPLVRRAMESLRLYDVIDKADDGDRFSKEWASFDPITRGQEIGVRVNGEIVLAPEDGYIVFPDYKAGAGDEWFYLAKANDRFA